VGTSQSSNGSPGGVPMIPPWVAELPPEPDPGAEGTAEEGEETGTSGEAGSDAPSEPAVPAGEIPIAPSSRFGGARMNLGNFAATGDSAAMRRGVGQYFKRGYGGGAVAVGRFRSTARTAAGLFGTLGPGPATIPGGPLDRAVLAGRSADEIMDAVVEAVRPVDGTQDSESSRAAIKDALADLLDRFPDGDLLNLQDDQRVFAVERFVAIDVFRRLQLDLGGVIQERAPTVAAAMSRLKEIREYVRETIAASFRVLRETGRQLVSGHISRIVQAAVREAVMVFQGYAE